MWVGSLARIERLVPSRQTTATQHVHLVLTGASIASGSPSEPGMVESYTAIPAAIDASTDPTRSGFAGYIHVFESALVVKRRTRRATAASRSPSTP